MDDVVIDLSNVLIASQGVRTTLLKLRAEHELARYEYTRQVRIAPGEIPHSHPILTLNTLFRDRSALLSVYLHEQMHWYVTWYSYAREAGWNTIWAALCARYPEVPVGYPEGSDTSESSLLHLIVNWLEVEAAAQFLGRPKAIELALKNPVYRALYRIVLDDWNVLAGLYRSNGLTPIRPASAMSADDLILAGRMEEAGVPSTPD